MTDVRPVRIDPENHRKLTRLLSGARRPLSLNSGDSSPNCLTKASELLLCGSEVANPVIRVLSPWFLQALLIKCVKNSPSGSKPFFWPICKLPTELNFFRKKVQKSADCALTVRACLAYIPPTNDAASPRAPHLLPTWSTPERRRLGENLPKDW